MTSFQAAFEITHVRNCPFYVREERFLLTDKAVELPLNHSSCLILVRELTGLLFTLMPYASTGFAEQRDMVFTCGGCTGLVKFQLTDKSVTSTVSKNPAPPPEDIQSMVSGRLDVIATAELLQVFHMHQKTGRLILEFENGPARVTFREGGLLAARYGDFDNQEAIYAILAQKEGSFRFIPGLQDALMNTRELGDFMMIIMEGLRRLDEGESPRSAIA